MQLARWMEFCQEGKIELAALRAEDSIYSEQKQRQDEVKERDCPVTFEMKRNICSVVQKLGIREGGATHNKKERPGDRTP